MLFFFQHKFVSTLLIVIVKGLIVLIKDLDLIVRFSLELLGKLVEMNLELINNFSDVSLVPMDLVYILRKVLYLSKSWNSIMNEELISI